MLEVPATWRSLTKIRIRELPDIGAKAARGARVQAGGELGGSNKKALALGETSEGAEGMRTKFIWACGPFSRGKPEPFWTEMMFAKGSPNRFQIQMAV